MKTKEQQLKEALQGFVDWWDAWTSSPNPADVEDPPVEEYRKLLSDE